MQKKEYVTQFTLESFFWGGGGEGEGCDKELLKRYIKQ